MRSMGKIYVEITPPVNAGSRIAYCMDIDDREFHEFLQPIHINKDPFFSDDKKEIDKNRKQREFFIGRVKDSIGFAFEKFFQHKDTINGELIEEGGDG